jgi:hypothetical protein
MLLCMCFLLSIHYILIGNLAEVVDIIKYSPFKQEADRLKLETESLVQQLRVAKKKQSTHKRETQAFKDAIQKHFGDRWDE